LEPLAVLRGQCRGSLGEALQSHMIDVLDGSARPCREAPAEYRSDIFIAYGLEHAFIDTTQGFECLDREQSVANIVERRLTLGAAGKNAEPAPERFRSIGGIVIKACAPGSAQSLVSVRHFLEHVHSRFGHAARFDAMNMPLHADDRFGRGACGSRLCLRREGRVVVAVPVVVIVGVTVIV